MPHTSCKGGEGEKNICSASQSIFLVPASNPADCKWSPDSASYHGIKKASKQAWHKKLITTLVFQVTTSGSLPNFAGYSQVSHKTAAVASPDSCTLSSAPHSRCPGCPGPRGTGRLLPPPAASRMHRDALLAAGTVGIPESLSPVLWRGRNRRRCPCRDTFSSPPFPRLQQAGARRSRPAGRRRRSGTEPWQRQVWASHHPSTPRSPASTNPCVLHGDDGTENEPSASEAKSWAPQVLGDKGGSTSKCCWCKAEKLQTPTI